MRASVASLPTSGPWSPWRGSSPWNIYPMVLPPRAPCLRPQSHRSRPQRGSSTAPTAGWLSQSLRSSPMLPLRCFLTTLQLGSSREAAAALWCSWWWRQRSYARHVQGACELCLLHVAAGAPRPACTGDLGPPNPTLQAIAGGEAASCEWRRESRKREGGRREEREGGKPSMWAMFKVTTSYACCTPPRELLGPLAHCRANLGPLCCWTTRLRRGGRQL